MRIENASTSFVSTSHVPKNENRPISEVKEEIVKPFRQEKENELETDKLIKEKIQNAVDSINKFLEPSYSSLKFSLHDKLGEYYVQVVDNNTKEVIREIPPKKLLDIYAAMKELLGFVVDKRI
ncbi:flagellar protein FlaG [Calidifontibacillus oryziterrae]|uniref:flagellar protein FlaG n=1 Tax=Calidifontibacillus oryziterrae TaxID=1191699 RepID=UPI000308E6B7|nr:flagellar protein FlaG [Calidifontibacillus oryziterrae]